MKNVYSFVMLLFVTLFLPGGVAVCNHCGGLYPGCDGSGGKCKMQEAIMKNSGTVIKGSAGAAFAVANLLPKRLFNGSPKRIAGVGGM